MRKESNESKKYIYTAVGFVLIFVMAGISISYAYWRITLHQTNSNVATSACFKLTLEDENPISLTSAYPMMDSDLISFYKTATPYHFTISNVCNTDALAVINLEVLDSVHKLDDRYVSLILYDGEKNLGTILTDNTEETDVYSSLGTSRTYNDVKIYDALLTNNTLNDEKILTDSLRAYKLYSVRINAGESKKFNLLEYMAPETPAIEEAMNKQFESKITVSTSYVPSENN